MINLKDLQVGDQVRIVDKWNEHTSENIDGFMDRWLGSVMTVKAACSSFVTMQEDGGQWIWNGHCIAEIIGASSVDIDDLV